MADTFPELDCPPAIGTLLRDTVEALEDLLGAALAGIYLHGSLAMGCFTEAGSDIDLLVMTRGPVEDPVLRDLAHLFVKLSERAPPKGFEISVVDTDAVHPFRHPAPFLLHYSSAFRDDFAAGRVDLGRRRTDVDLAAHLTMAKARGLRLAGAPLEQALPDVPRPAFLDAVGHDALESVAQIVGHRTAGPCPVPTYGVLNLCRIVALLSDGKIRSKAEGGEWCLQHVDPVWHDVVGPALQQYRNPIQPVLVDGRSLVAFAQWAGGLVAAAGDEA